LLAAACFGQTISKSHQLILLDGSTIAVGSFEIADGQVSGDGVPGDLTLDDLQRIESTADSAAHQVKPAMMIELRGAGRLAAKQAMIGNELCKLTTTGDVSLSLPLDLVRALRFDPAAMNADFDKAVQTPSAELDRVFVKDDAGKLGGVAGLVEALTERQITLEIGGQAHAMPRERLFGIVIAQPNAADPPPPCLITFHDGSTLGGQAIALNGGKATIDLPIAGKAEFPWSAVRRVGLRSSRVAFLSEMKPIAEEQQAIVTLPLPWQRDKSVAGKPLTIGTQVYEKGIGVHARSSLAFALDKKWDTLAATIGLDAGAGGKGDCVFVVVADGQPIFSRRMRGTDPPHELQLPITGREQITLLVEPGEGLDMADHANWCDVRLLKSRK
jgi:hypothetical protein